MASYDVIDAGLYGYRFFWRERQYLLRLAAGPLFIKFVCFITVGALGFEENFLRQGLILLPSYLADGWMLAHFVRLIFLDQRWPFRPTGQTEEDRAMLRERAEGVIAGMVFFAVSRYLISGYAHIVWQISAKVDPSAEVPPEIGTAAFILVAIGLWSFRYLWMFIPAALSWPIRDCLKDIRGFAASFYMIGTYLISFVPVFLVFGLLASIFLAPLGTISPVAEFVATFLRAGMDTAIALVATAAMSWGLRSMISARQQKIS